MRSHSSVINHSQEFQSKFFEDVCFENLTVLDIATTYWVIIALHEFDFHCIFHFEIPYSAVYFYNIFSAPKNYFCPFHVRYPLIIYSLSNKILKYALLRIHLYCHIFHITYNTATTHIINENICFIKIHIPIVL